MNYLLHVDILFIQEHWLAESQLNVFGTTHVRFHYNAVFGFGNYVVLSGRPYGVCAILWRSNIMASVCLVLVNSRRICAI